MNEPEFYEDTMSGNVDHQLNETKLRPRYCKHVERYKKYSIQRGKLSDSAELTQCEQSLCKMNI